MAERLDIRTPMKLLTAAIQSILGSSLALMLDYVSVGSLLPLKRYLASVDK